MSLTEDISLNGANVTITGADTGITILGKVKITRSTVAFRTITLVGKAGSNGNSPLPGLTSCPSAGDGGNGGDALEADSSAINFYMSEVRGGSGGDGGKAYIDYSPGMPCDCGNSGSGGRGIVVRNSLVHAERTKISGGNAGLAGLGQCSAGAAGTSIAAQNNTTIDTLKVIFGAVAIDSTSKIIAGKTGNAERARLQKQSKEIAIHFLSSGTIQFMNTTSNDNIKIAIYSLSGRLVYSRSIKNEKSVSPQLRRGVYVASITRGQGTTSLKYAYVR